MELIERYIYSIRRRLLGSNKDDIVKEINSLIMDELEGKYGSKAEYTKDEIEAVLIEMGHPREVASRYRGDKQYLIGPEVFPIYKMMLAIVAGAVTLGLFVSFVVSSFGAESSREIALNFLELIPSIFTALLGAIGGLTVAFWLMDRFAKFNKKELDFNEGWKPRDLPELPHESDRVRMWEPIMAIIFIIIWAVFINSYAGYGGMPYVKAFGDNVAIFPIFNIEAVRYILPLWNISIGLSLILQVILLKTGKWQLGTRIAEIGLNVFSIAILAVMITGPMLISFDGMIKIFEEPEFNAVNIQKYYYIGLKVIMGLSALGVVTNTIKLIAKQARKANV